jgi:hypothetical protein
LDSSYQCQAFSFPQSYNSPDLQIADRSYETSLKLDMNNKFKMSICPPLEGIGGGR